ncbi:hypothetical protein BH11MYX2_BH11MYX2_07850 [soil metagenome]
MTDPSNLGTILPVIRPLSLCLAFKLAACSGDDGADGPAVDASIDAPAAVTTVFVVRHAETTGSGTDPLLSAAGQARSELLATKLAGANISAIYTSEYHRTHDTAVPASTASSVAITVRPIASASATTYGMELATLVGDATPPQAILIVGHSNTVPETVKALSGTTIAPIAETEYDRMYTITLGDDGAVVDASTY